MTSPIEAVAVIGPPACGKSTLTARWKEGGARTVFRLSAHIYARARTDPGLRAAIEATTDPLGWLPDAVVCPLVQAALAHPGYSPAPGARLLMENYPGTAAQARHLSGLLPGRLAALELVLPPGAEEQRAAQRRVCGTCEPDPLQDPRSPAAFSVTAGLDEHCVACGSPVTARPSDRPELLARRVQRYRENSPAIRSAFASADVRVHRIDASAPPADVAEQARAALAGHTVPAPPAPTGK